MDRRIPIQDYAVAAASQSMLFQLAQCARAALAVATVLVIACGALQAPHALAQGAAQDGGVTTRAPRALVMDYESGAILYQKQADELAPPASMSKLMTLAVLFKNIKDGKVRLADEFEMSVNAWKTGGAPSQTSSMFVPVNTKATVDQLIRGIIVQSGNDAAICVAEALAGSEAAFAKMMTAEARRIGLEKSTFSNATGLYEPNHLMTARELGQLARYLIAEYPDLYPIFAQRRFEYRKHNFINRNPLLFLDIGVDGLKTGQVRQSGYGLVASAVKDGRRLIVVVAGLDTSEGQKSEAARLIDWGFKSISRVKVFDDAEVVGSARVWGGTQMYVPLAGKGDVMFSLPKYPANQRISGEIVYKAPLKPPVKKGDQVAILRLISSSSAMAEIPLYAQEDVEKAGIMRQGFDTLVLMALRRLAL